MKIKMQSRNQGNFLFIIGGFVIIPIVGIGIGYLIGARDLIHF